MAYYNGFPVTYQPAYYQTNPYYQQNQPMTQQNQQAQTQSQQQPAIQQSGFVPVPSEQVARNYPVAPGNSVTFKDENAPYCYVKTMGFNQLDRPTFEKYRLVKEDSQNIDENTPKTENDTKDGNDTKYALKSDLDAIWCEIDALKEKSKTEKKKNKLVVMEENDDE